MVNPDIWEAIQLGAQIAVPELLSILKDKTDNRAVREEASWALRKFGRREAVLYLPRLISSDYNNSTRENELGELMQNFSTIRIFAHLLRHRISTSSTIYQALWAAASKEKVRILMFNCGPIRLVRVKKQR